MNVTFPFAEPSRLIGCAHLNFVEVVKDVARVLGTGQWVAGVVGINVDDAVLLLHLESELGACGTAMNHEETLVGDKSLSGVMVRRIHPEPERNAAAVQLCADSVHPNSPLLPPACRWKGLSTRTEDVEAACVSKGGLGQRCGAIRL
jgi:hypothetical protein